MQNEKRKKNRVIHSLLASALIASMLGGLAQPALAVEPVVAEPEEIAAPVEPDNGNTELTTPEDVQDTAPPAGDTTVDDAEATDAESAETLINGGFETGDLSGWTLLNGDNVATVSSEATYWPEMPTRYYYQEGTHFLLSNEGTSGGAIRSSTFTLGGDGYIAFLIGGANTESKGSVKVYQVNDGGDDTLVATYTNPEWRDPDKGMTLLRRYGRLTDCIGKQLYFVVENGTDTSGFAFINVDDFRTSLTLNEVKELHKSEMQRIRNIDDKFKDAIIESYKAYGLAEADYAELVSTVPETITRYAGDTVELPELISGFTRAEMAYKGKAVSVTVSDIGVAQNGEMIQTGGEALTLSEGTYDVTYKLTYSGITTEALSFTIDVQSAGAVPHDVENGGFETGDLSGWTILTESVWGKDESGAYKGISSDQTYWGEKLPYNQEGNYHLNGWEVTGDEAVSWGIRSSMFTLGGSGWISLRMGGNAAQVRIYKENGTLIWSFDQTRFHDISFPYIGKGGSWADMGTYFIDLSDYLGQQLYVELWDKTMDGPWRLAFFDAVKCYYEDVPDVANGSDTVTAPVDKIDDVLQYGDVKIPWTQLHIIHPSEGDGVVYLSFDGDTGFNAANAWGWKQNATLTSVFTNPAYQDEPVEPYRPKGVKGKALNFDGYSNSLSYSEVVEGSKLTIDVYVCPRVFCWSAPQDARENHIPEVITGSYNTGSKAGFLLGVTKHGYLTFRIGTGNNWYNLVGNADSVLPTYEWSRVTAVFDGDAGKMNLYLNGKPAGEKDIEAGSQIAGTGSSVLVGRGSEAVTYEVSDKTMFPGLMDELTISMTAKTAAEVAASGYTLPEISYEDAMTPESALAGDYYRPQYHPAPSGNWMNEPHALFQYNGRWHLFYQFAPAGPYWQTISWGHWVSDDMVSWEYVKEAVIPTENSVTPDAVWTGNMIFDSEGKPLLLITAGDDGRSVSGSNQHVGLVKAVDYSDPDLTDWEIIGYAKAQESGMGKIGEFRDAQCFGIGNERYMVVGGAQDVPEGQAQQGVAHIFRTTAKTAGEWKEACKGNVLNGMEWEYMGSLLGDFFEDENHPYLAAYGDVWEMPNLVPLSYADGTPSGKYLFVFSPQHGSMDVRYFIGTFDPDTCRFTPDFSEAKLMDYGHEIFTGPTLYLNGDGKVYISSIMQDGRSAELHRDAGWAHFAGLPRELFLKEDGTLGITHVDTTPIEGNRIVSFENLTAAAANEKLKAVASDLIKVDFAFSGDPSAEVGFILKKSGNTSSRLYLNGTTLGLDDKSGSYAKDGTVKGTIYVDKCSIEAYIDDSIAISGVKYLRGTGLEVFMEGEATCSVTVTEVNSIRDSKQPDKDYVSNTTRYQITIPTATPNGTVTVTPKSAEFGAKVTITAKPDEGYTTGSVTVTARNGRNISVTDKGGNIYTFIMPDSRVSVEVSFTKIADNTPAENEPFTGLGTPGISGIVLNPAAMPFTDVNANSWYYNSVDYVWKHYLLSGVSDTQFSPNTTTSRAMIWTLLARMNNVRTDINPGSTWYEKGMLWAMEQGVTDGSSAMSDITREQLATMLWRNAGSPGGTVELNQFSDSGSVSGYALSAVRWAVATGILQGSDGKLNPKGTATRAQVAAMVMRYGERIGA
ncbi:MAG: S-layer homology domain-containing protein [Oscillospiraceae bacterium]|nr:S-layer homology domain-containing protein [Oscillospiraceae bacterium]